MYVMLVDESCSHWMHYSDATKARSGWVEELLQEFKSNFELLKQAVKDHNVESPSNSLPNGSPQHIQTGILLLLGWLCS